MAISKEILNHIAGSMEAGEKCFIHKKTLQVITYPEDYLLELEADDYMENMPWKEEMEKVRLDADNFIEIEKMSSVESYRVMEEFVDSLENSLTKIRLIQAIIGRKPFANFKHQVETSGSERELWFAFRRQKNIEWIEDQLVGENLT